ncbi:MAG: DUF3880 domain-containing protein [Lachnospiraceae bacterium]|nr:DUF3880 domain-containing protein [Lachnospiraceae bacterium]
MSKILVYRWKAYNYIDVMAAFVKMGYEIDEISQNLLNYDVDEEFAERLEKQIHENDYDFVFSVNYFGMISDVCQNNNILYVAWSCDSPMISMHHESVYNSCNRIFVFDRANCLEFENMGVKNVYYLPLAAGVERIDELLNTKDAINSKCFYECDISFVGSLYERNNYDELYDKLSDYLKGYFDGLIEAKWDCSDISLMDKMLTPDVLNELEKYFEFKPSSERSFSDLGLVFSNNTLGFKIARTQRKNNLIELSKRRKVALFTGSDASDLIRVDNRGPVDYWKEMPRVFVGSKINLNMTIPNIRTGIPLRVWDILASGGFLISNNQAEIPYFFENGRDIVTYSCQEELIELVDYYMSRDEERESIAKRATEKMRKYHTFDDRIANILEVVKKDL